LYLKGDNKVNQVLKIQDLKESIKNRKQNNRGKVLDILPFESSKRKPAIRNQFNKVLGEFVREVCELELDKNRIKLDEQLSYGSEIDDIDRGLTEIIADKLDYENADDKHDFIRFLRAYLFSEESINPIHPYLYNYIGFDEKYKNEFSKYAVFINEIFVNNNNDIREIFNNKESDDILTEIILTEIEALKTKKSKKKQQYEPLLSNFAKTFQKDLIYLSKHKDYFLTSFPLITHYYVFMYICQLVFKFEQFINADYSKTQSFYFALDWESISKRREAASGLESFKAIKEKSENLFPHIHTISHLNHNSINEEYLNNQEKVIPFIPYSKLYYLIKEKGEEFEKTFLIELKDWIKDYSDIMLKTSMLDEATTVPEAFKSLHSSVKAGMSEGVYKKYGANIEDLGANQFIKSRGSLGQVFNLRQDFLLILTAVSVKDKRIPLNDLFIEFEKRGVALDLHSKKEVITLFDNLNIIDKKSDSGDAQYVKPIL